MVGLALVALMVVLLGVNIGRVHLNLETGFCASGLVGGYEWGVWAGSGGCDTGDSAD